MYVPKQLVFQAWLGHSEINDGNFDTDLKQKPTHTSKTTPSVTMKNKHNILYVCVYCSNSKSLKSPSWIVSYFFESFVHLTANIQHMEL